MSSADAAAYAALDLAPGSPWPLVHAAWRDLVKRHHPDRTGIPSPDGELRLRQVNAAYAHLCRREAALVATPSRLVAHRQGILARNAVWDQIWEARRWPTWLPGVRHAERITGTCDHRRAIRGHWAGHRFSAQVLFMGVTPPCRLSGRVMELRVDGRTLDLGLPPRVWVMVTATDSGTEVELGLETSGHALPPVLLAAMQAALTELLDLDELGSIAAAEPPALGWREAAA